MLLGDLLLLKMYSETCGWQPPFPIPFRAVCYGDANIKELDE